MRGVNKVILIGNLGRDPELKKTPGGSSVVSFSIATTETWNGRDGSRQEKTEWHNIVAWNKLADIAGQYLKKGRPVFVEGKLTTRTWEGKEGVKQYRTEIIASNIQFLGSNTAPDSSSNYGAPANDGFSEPTNTPVRNEPIIEDDLPF